MSALVFITFDSVDNATSAAAWLNAHIPLVIEDIGGGRHAPHNPNAVAYSVVPRWDAKAWAIPVDASAIQALPALRAAVAFAVPDAAELDSAWDMPKPIIP